MKRVKCLVLVLILFITCGCEVNYTLKITDGTTFDETIDIYEESTNTTSREQFERAKNNKVELFYSDNPVGDFIYQREPRSYYNVSEYNLNGNYGLRYQGSMDLEDYTDSNALNNCADTFNVSISENVVRIQISKFKCVNDYADLNSLRVSIDVDRSILYSNEDLIADDSLVWLINASNYNTKTITLYYKLNNNRNISGEDMIKPDEKEQGEVTPSEETPDKKDTTENAQLKWLRAFAKEHPVIVLLLSFVLLGIVILIVVKIKKRKL